MTVPMLRQGFFKTILLVLLAVSAGQGLAWSPVRLPPGVDVEICGGASGVSYRLMGREISGDKLNDALAAVARKNPETHLCVRFPREGDGPSAKGLVELFSRAKSAGLHNVTFWWFSESKQGRMEGPYDPGPPGMGPLYLSLTYPSPYDLRQITQDARLHLKDELKPEVAAELRKTLIPEVLLVHLWKALLLVFAAGALAGWFGRKMVFGRRRASEPAAGADPAGPGPAQP